MFISNFYLIKIQKIKHKYDIMRIFNVIGHNFTIFLHVIPYLFHFHTTANNILANVDKTISDRNTIHI